MAHYWKRCPYCRHTIEEGHGFPSKRLGNPKKYCRFCLREYNDSSVIEWEQASVFRKIFYHFANGRFWLCFLPSFISVAVLKAKTACADWLIYLIGFAIFSVIFALCALYVRRQVKDYLLIYTDGKHDKNKNPNVNYEKYKDGLFGDHELKDKK